MSNQYDVYHVYGTVGKDTSGYKVRKQTKKEFYEDIELEGGILSITITSYGDDPSDGFVQVVCVDEDAGKNAYMNTARVWLANYNKPWSI